MKTAINIGKEPESWGNIAQNRKLSIECNKEAITNNIVKQTEKVEHVKKSNDN